MGFDHPWGKDKRPFHGGEYPYETVVTVYLPEGVAASTVDGTALESRGMALLGQLEVNRRLAGLPSMTTHYTEADGTYYEYGSIMGRPFVRVWPVGTTSNPISGRSGVVFYHEAVRSATVYRQGIVARDANGTKPDQYQQFDGPWLGYASKNKASLLTGSTPLDEALMFQPNSANWSQALQVHVVTQLAQISYDNDNDFMSRVFIGGVCVLQSNSVDFVGAQLYGDALLFAFVDVADASGNLVMGGRSLPSISYQETFDYTPGPSYKVLSGDFAGDETICNFHPAKHEAQFIASKRSAVNPVDRTITLRLGHYTATDGWVVEESITDFKIVSSTDLLVSTPITVVRDYVYTMDAGGAYPMQVWATLPNITDDYALEINIPSSSVSIILDDFPVWVGYDDSGVRTVYRMNGTATAEIGGTLAIGYHFVQTGASSSTTYDTPDCPSTSFNSTVDLRICKGSAGFEAVTATIPFEFLAMSANLADGPNIDGNNFVSALSGIGGGKSIHAKLSRTGSYSMTTSYQSTSAVGESSLTGATVTFNPASDVNTSTTFALASVSPAFGFPKTANKINSYQRLANTAGVLIEEHGSPIPDTTLSEYVSSDGALGPGNGLGPDPYTGSPVPGPGVVTRTITYDLSPTIRTTTNVLNCVVVGNFLNRGCLYDHSLKKHIVSPWGVFVSDIISATGNNTKRVFCVGASSIDITPDFLTAGRNDVAVTPQIQPIGDLSTGDFFDPRGLL